MRVNLSDIIAPSFHSLHRDICGHRYTHYWLKGGRGSAKSSFVSIEIIIGIMKDKNANAVAIRKVAENLGDSVYTQLLWAIDVLGVDGYWVDKRSPMELIYTETGQRIVFRGADKPKKIKSTKFKSGYCKFIWYEELDEFNGVEEIRIINQSLMRGGDEFAVFYTYNPPQSKNNWVNSESCERRDDRIVHHSTYLTVPPEWLGKAFLVEAEHLKKTKPEIYAHDYMGEITGTGSEIFKNLSIREISDAEIKTFDSIRRGVDFGYAVDPFCYIVTHYDKTRKRLYIYHEVYKVELSNTKAVDLIKLENKSNGAVTADSAEPKSIAEMRALGLRIHPARKGPDSIEFGVKFLQDLEEIIIDNARCPNAAREFRGYEYTPDKNDGFKASYPDKDNHTIDACRYALEGDMINKQVKIVSKTQFGGGLL